MPPTYPEASNLPCIKIGGVWWAPVNCGYDATHTYGLLYQWGRKYGQGYDGEAPTVVPIEYDSAYSSHVDTDDTNKDNFYYNNSLYNWYGGSDPDKLWDTTGGSKESHTPAKSSYDPCPAGWRVPTYAELNALFGENNEASLVEVGGQEGIYFNGTSNCTSSTEGAKVFLPAAGSHNCKTGIVSDRGLEGQYWSSSVSGEFAWRLYFYQDSPSMGDPWRAGGYSVRCVKE